MILEGRTILVSGVGPGLGREVATAAHRDGANVVIGARTVDRIESLAAELDPSGTTVVAQPLDVTDPASCEAAAAAAADRFGALHAVVNVAARDFLPGGLMDADPEQWRAGLETNVIGTINVVRAAVPHLRTAGGGSVVLIGSQSSVVPPPGMPMAAYGASKAAVESLQRNLVAELGPDRIRVNTVVPTWMWGPPVQMYVDFTASQRGVERDEVVAELRSRFPLGEIPADEDVAEAVVFLCSERARMITGQNLFVNAGEYLR